MTRVVASSTLAADAASSAPYWTLLGAVCAAIITAFALLWNESRKRRNEGSKELRVLVRQTSLQFLTESHRSFRAKVQDMDESGIVHQVDIRDLVACWSELQMPENVRNAIIKNLK